MKSDTQWTNDQVIFNSTIYKLPNAIKFADKLNKVHKHYKRVNEVNETDS